MARTYFLFEVGLREPAAWYNRMMRHWGISRLITITAALILTACMAAPPPEPAPTASPSPEAEGRTRAPGPVHPERGAGAEQESRAAPALACSLADILPQVDALLDGTDYQADYLTINHQLS